MARAMIEDTRDRHEVAGIKQALGNLRAFDERFFGDVIGGGEPDFRWAVYCSAYLIDDPHIAAVLIQKEAADGALFDFNSLRKRSLKSKCLANASTKFNEYDYLMEIRQTCKGNMSREYRR